MLASRKKKFSICKECKKATNPAINAAKLGHTDCLVTAYRELGVFNERDDFGATPIHFAARNGKLECLQWLVERSGVSPNAATLNGNTAAHDAAATGHVDCLEYLISNTRCGIADTNAEGATVLHVACRFGQTEVVQWLVEKAGCPLNSKGDNDVSAIHLSAAKNHLGCLKWLTSHQDYIPNEKTVHGATPVYFAAQEGSFECLQWLIEHGKGHAYQTALDGMAPIHAAAQAGQITCLEYMVKGASVSVRSRADDGATPAHFAAASGQVECLKWIFDNGGSFLDRDNLGGTPVHDAAEQGQVNSLTFFLECGMDVNAKDSEGLKPMDLAKENNHEDAYQLLFRKAKPKLLTSIEPDRSLSRSTGILTKEQKEIVEAENRQKFDAMTGSNKMASQPSAVDRQKRRSSAGFHKSLETKELSPDVDDVNAAILKTMETHEIHTETGKDIILRKKSPVSSPVKETEIQSPKKSLLGLFISQPKQTTPKKSVNSPTAAVGDGLKSPKSPKSPRGPAKKKVRKRQVIVKKKSRISQSRPGKLQVEKSVSDERNVDSSSPPASPVSLPASPTSLPSNFPSTIKVSPPVFTSELPSSPTSLPNHLPVPLTPSPPSSPSASPQSLLSPPVSHPGPVLTAKPKQPPENEAKTIEEVSTPKQDLQQKKKYSSSLKTPQANTNQKTPASDTSKKRLSSSSQKRQVKRHPVARKRHATSTSVLTKGSGPSPAKRQPSSKKPRPVSEGGGGRRFSIDKFLPGNKDNKEDQTIVHSVSNVGFDENEESSAEILEASNEVGDSIATGLVQSVLADVIEGSTIQLDDIKTRQVKAAELNESLSPESVAKELVQGVIKEVISNTGTPAEGENQDNVISSIPTPPPPPPLPPPPLVAYVFRPEFSPEKEKPKTRVDDTQHIPESVEAIRNDLEVMDESFVITFVAETSETRHEKATTDQGKEDMLKEKGLTHKEKLELEQEKLKNKRESVRTSWEEKWVYRGPLESALYSKIHEFQKQRVERGYTDVLKKADDFQASSSATSVTDSDTDKDDGATDTRGGILSSRLRMFGGAAGFVKEAPAKEKKKVKKVQKDKHLKSGDNISPLVDAESSANCNEVSPDVATNRVESDSHIPVDSSLKKHEDSSEGSDSIIFARGISPRRRSSSCVSITAFETIEEEGQSKEDSTESLDKVTPLPKIGLSLSRRQSTELLRLDGMIKDGAENDQIDREKGWGSRKASTSSLGESSLVHAIKDPKDVPTIDAKAAYMNSANLPHINKERDECEGKEMDRLKQMINSFTLEPPWADSLQVKFKGLNADDIPKVQIWQFNHFTVKLLPSMKDVEFGSSDIYMFFQVCENGPLLYHIYLWLGMSISRQILNSIYSYVQNLALSLPGKPVIHREFYGYESLSFHQMLGPEGVNQLNTSHTSNSNYVNTRLSQTTISTYSGSSFTAVDSGSCNYKFVSSRENPLVLNSPSCLYVWLPTSYWEEQMKGKQDLVLNISEKFISTKSLPKWTPVVAMTQGGEVSSFCDHFSDWEWGNLSFSHESHKLHLQSITPPKMSTPATGQLKAWTLLDGELVATGISDLGQFFSDQVHIVHYTYPQQSSLYTWMEGVVYIWLGLKVQASRDQVLKEVGEKLPSVIAGSNLPTVIVPEGLEPPQLLYLFKGKFIVQKSRKLQDIQLFKLSGENPTTVKTEEVQASASSLHSFHAFCLVSDGKPTCVWAGQFANKTLRRAALVVVKSISKSKQILVMSEGLEVKEFWQNLGGAKVYPKYSPSSKVDYLSASFYSAYKTLNKISFKKVNTINKEEQDSKMCYVLVYRNQMLIRMGKDSDKKQFVPSILVNNYIQQHCGFKTENDFVITVLHEESEGDIFRKWLAINDTTPQTLDDETDGVTDMTEQEDTEEVNEEMSSTFIELKTASKIEEKPKDATEVLPAIEATVTAELNRMEPPNDQEKAKFLEQIANESEEMFKDMTSSLQMSQASPVVYSVSPPQDNSQLEKAPPAALNYEMPSAPEIVVSKVNEKPVKATGKTDEQSAIVAEAKEKNKAAPLSPVKKKRSASAIPMVGLSIFIPELDKTVQIRVKESANILTVIFKAAEAGPCKVREYYAIFETFETLGIQRALEDHEVVKDVISHWPKKKDFQPTLSLKIFPTKNQLWAKNPPIPKENITGWTKGGVPPNIGMNLYRFKRGTSKPKWVQERYVMLKNGMTCEKEGADKSLSSSLEHNLYIPFKDCGKINQPPTSFCFIMKPPNKWIQEDMKIYCTPDSKTLSQWIHTVRLLKHGLQLKGNYLAMKKRIDAITAKDLLKESTAITR